MYNVHPSSLNSKEVKAAQVVWEIKCIFKIPSRMNSCTNSTFCYMNSLDRRFDVIKFPTDGFKILAISVFETNILYA